MKRGLKKAAAHRPCCPPFNILRVVICVSFIVFRVLKAAFERTSWCAKSTLIIRLPKTVPSIFSWAFAASCKKRLQRKKKDKSAHRVLAMRLIIPFSKQTHRPSLSDVKNLLLLRTLGHCFFWGGWDKTKGTKGWGMQNRARVSNTFLKAERKSDGKAKCIAEKSILLLPTSLLVNRTNP